MEYKNEIGDLSNDLIVNDKERKKNSEYSPKKENFLEIEKSGKEYDNNETKHDSKYKKKRKITEKK